MFTDVLSNLDKVEQDILGPDYEYWKQIKDPSDMGMSSSGDKIGTNINGLIDYVRLLVTGGGGASKTGNPLGNKFFMKTGSQCKDKKTGKQVDRYVYVNNVPDGSIPFISSGLGVDFTEFEGLIPGMLSDVTAIKPFAILQSFMMGSNPECQAVTLETIDANNKTDKATHFVTTVDLENMNPAWFPDKVNPFTKEKRIEAFAAKRSKSKLLNNHVNNMISNHMIVDKEMILKSVCYGATGFVLLYILYKLFEKKK